MCSLPAACASVTPSTSSRDRSTDATSTGRPGVEPRELQQVGDERAHPHRLRLDAGQGVLDVLRGLSGSGGSARRTRESPRAACAARGSRRPRTGAPASRWPGASARAARDVREHRVDAPSPPDRPPCAGRCPASGTRTASATSPRSRGISETRRGRPGDPPEGLQRRSRMIAAPARPATSRPSSADHGPPPRRGGRRVSWTSASGSPVTRTSPSCSWCGHQAVVTEVTAEIAGVRLAVDRDARATAAACSARRESAWPRRCPAPRLPAPGRRRRAHAEGAVPPGRGEQELGARRPWWSSSPGRPGPSAPWDRGLPRR